MTVNNTTRTSSAVSNTGWSFQSGTTGDNVKITAGALASAPTIGQVKFLLWTAEYKIDGKTFKTYAFTSCYAPYDKPVVAAARAYNDGNGGDRSSEDHSMAWAVGLTSASTGGGREILKTYFDPINNKIELPTATTSDNGGNGVIWQDENNTEKKRYHYISSTDDTVRLYNASTDNRYLIVYSEAPTGYLTMDSARFNNLEYVPNLKFGYIISATKEGKKSLDDRQFGYHVSYFENTPSYTGSGSWNTNKAGGTATGEARYNEKGFELASYQTSGSKPGANLCGPRMVSNNVSLNSTVTSSKKIWFKGASFFYVNKSKQGYAKNSCLVPVQINVVDKSALRNKVHSLTNNMYQAEYYTNSSEFTTYMNQLCRAYVEMGNPASTTTSVSITEPSSYNPGTATAYHKSTTNSENKLVIYNPNGSPSQQVVTESKNYKYGDIIFSDYNEYTGYRQDHFEPEKNTVGCALEQSYTWNFWYNPIQYNIDYDLNGGIVNGSNPTTYNIENSFTLINPKKTGYTFVGWSGTGIAETSMNVNVSVGSIGDRKYVAHFEPNKYTLLLDNEFDFDKWAKGQPNFGNEVIVEESEDHSIPASHTETSNLE